MTATDLRRACHCGRHGIGAHWHSLQEGCTREPVKNIDERPVRHELDDVLRENGIDPADYGDGSGVGLRWGPGVGAESYVEPVTFYPPAEHDPVNSPAHYLAYPVEVIEITEHLNFCLGNVVKYALRADHKGNALEDLAKAAWYLNREIERREREAAAAPEQPGAVAERRGGA